MIKHIVMFKFKEEKKQENINNIQKLLEELTAKIDKIKDLEVGINFDTAARAMDLVLYTTFDNKQDLNSYVNHKEHQKVVSVIKEVTEYSKVVDYII